MISNIETQQGTRFLCKWATYIPMIKWCVSRITTSILPIVYFWDMMLMIFFTEVYNDYQRVSLSVAYILDHHISRTVCYLLYKWDVTILQSNSPRSTLGYYSRVMIILQINLQRNKSKWCNRWSSFCKELFIDTLS